MTLIATLQSIPDPRRKAGRRYPLWLFLLLVILGTMSGYRGYRGLSRFMERHQAHLAHRLGLPHAKLPTYSTIRRLLMAIDFNAVADAFNHWAQASQLVQFADHCAIDGKALASTVTDADNPQQDFVNLVSVFQLESGMVVGQAAFNNHHQSEIEGVYQLLEKLQLSGVTLSLDALHAQKKTVALIHQQGNDYVIGVKANQKKLYEQLRELGRSDAVWSIDLTSERTRNRETQRVAAVFELPEWVKQQWVGAQVGITVVRWGRRQGRAYFEQRYYISSWREKAEGLQGRIRGHWGIENLLHWVKDVVLGEDESTIATKGAATVLGMIRNLVITLYRRAGYRSIKGAIDRFSNDLDQLLPMLGFSSS